MMMRAHAYTSKTIRTGGIHEQHQIGGGGINAAHATAERPFTIGDI